jgi:hypothetical protein
MLKEFKAFAIKGNVMDLAVGVIIGAAFGKIVDSAVNDLIMPIVSALIGRLDFSNFFLALGTPPVGTPHDPGGPQKSRRSGICLRQLHHGCRQLRFAGLHHFRDDQANQPPQKC